MNDDERRWLEECFRSVRDDIAGVNRRLDALNGSVRAHGETLVRHEQAIGIIRWIAGGIGAALVGLGATVYLPRLLALLVR